MSAICRSPTGLLGDHHDVPNVKDPASLTATSAAEWRGCATLVPQSSASRWQVMQSDNTGYQKAPVRSKAAAKPLYARKVLAPIDKHRDQTDNYAWPTATDSVLVELTKA